MEGALFFLFSRVFSKPPTQELISKIIENQLLTLASLGSSHSKAQVLEENTWCEQQEEIEKDYARLFSVPSEVQILPYESYYRDEIPIGFGDWQNFSKIPIERGMRGFLGGPTVSKLKQLYESEGLFHNQDFPDLLDHMGCELEFLGHLYEKGDIKCAHRFFNEHLKMWGIDFLKKVEERAQTSFYKTASRSLQLFLKSNELFF